MKLDQFSDGELDECFAMIVAGWRPGSVRRHDGRFANYRVWTLGKWRIIWHALPFTHDMNLVLPWLEYHQWFARSYGLSGSTKGYPDAEVKVIDVCRPDLSNNGVMHTAFSQGPHALPRAAVIAMLRAHLRDDSRDWAKTWDEATHTWQTTLP